MRTFLTLLSLVCFALPVAAQPWWEAETALTPEGSLEVPLCERAWWNAAAALSVDESILLMSKHDGGGQMLVRREVGTPVPYDLQVWGEDLLQEGEEMIVWILDDDGDMDPDHPEGDRDSDAYVVDYGADGVVDRMLDYMDEDGDDDPDLQDIRYFSDGALKHSIVHHDLDDDNHQYPTHDYQRLVGPLLAFLIDAYGDNLYYHNKYDPSAQRWLPFSECPFAFHDTDGDGQSERVVRVSAAPLAFDARNDPDFANSWSRLMGPVEPIMRDMGAMAVRYSLDVDGGSSDEEPLHYELGFHLIGEVPYDLVQYRVTHPLRRPPRVSYRIPHEETLAFAESYPATATGFSWREFPDATQQLGDFRGRLDYDQRWEGIFWTWQRRFMHNTGGPNQYWNVRREYDGDFSSRRELYYSPVDQRLHLKGAEEGWLPVGAMVDQSAVGEIRMFDTTDDGYFDRWEYFRAGEEMPYRVASVPDADNRNLGSDLEEIGRIYTREYLPNAIAAHRRLISGLRNVHPGRLSVEDGFDGEISDVERLYILGVIREEFYRLFRDRVDDVVFDVLGADPIAGFAGERQQRRHEAAWNLSVLAARSDALYDRAEYEAVDELLDEMVAALKTLRSDER